MALSSILALAIIVGLSNASPNSLSVQRRSTNGDTTIYMKGDGEEEGVMGTYSTLSHPTRDDVKVIVTKVTDSRETIVKNVYDNGGEMLDCDVQINQQGARQFVKEVEKHMETLAREQSNHVSQSNIPKVHNMLTNVQLQAANCENFLQTRADEESMPQARLPLRVPVDLDEPEEIDGDQDEEQGRSRQKRAYLIWPGTNWCGKGSKAEFSESYGEHVETDKCCQKHDQCPYIIEGFTTKYNLFNYRIHTLSICDCDEKFMGCLKSANTSTSVMVGKVFFNVVNTECFDLKLQKSCAKRSWWGGCEKYTTKWTATIRALGNFPEN